MATSEPQSPVSKDAPQSPPVQMNVPTVKPAESFSADGDAAALRAAIHGVGKSLLLPSQGAKDPVAIINILAARSNAQRQDIKLKYKANFGKQDLAPDLELELRGKLKTTIVAMMDVRPLTEAKSLHKAKKGVGVDEKAFIEILCTRSNQELRDIAAAYRAEYGKELEDEIRTDTTFCLKTFFLGLLQGKRDEGITVSVSGAKKDALELQKAGISSWRVEGSKFSVLMTIRSYPQLKVVFDEYSKLIRQDVATSIDQSEFSAEEKTSFKAFVRCIRDRPGFFAERLHDSLKGTLSDDTTIIRILVARSETDLVDIKRRFEELYQKPLARAIADDISGDYCTVLKALLGEK